MSPWTSCEGYVFWWLENKLQLEIQFYTRRINWYLTIIRKRFSNFRFELFTLRMRVQVEPHVHLNESASVSVQQLVGCSAMHDHSFPAVTEYIFYKTTCRPSCRL